MTLSKPTQAAKFRRALIIPSALAVALAAVVWRGFSHDAPTPSAQVARRHASPIDPAVAVEPAAFEPQAQPSPAAGLQLPPATGNAEAIAPLPAPDVESPILAATRAHRFSGPTEELAFWTERARGEHLTLRSRQQSLTNAERVLSRSDLTDVQRTALEQRKAVIAAKVEQQARQVEEIEGRISEMKRKGASDGT